MKSPTRGRPHGVPRSVHEIATRPPGRTAALPEGCHRSDKAPRRWIVRTSASPTLASFAPPEPLCDSAKLTRSVRFPPTNNRSVPGKPASKPKPAGGASFEPLKTERLTLRPLRPNDAEALHRLVNDWEVTRTLAEVRYPIRRSLADDWIASTAQQLADGSAYHLAITGQEGRKEILVGVVGLRLDATRRTGRLGYWVGRAYWGHGVATEAARRHDALGVSPTCPSTASSPR